jgi:hypothetical protein
MIFGGKLIKEWNNTSLCNTNISSERAALKGQTEQISKDIKIQK